MPPVRWKSSTATLVSLLCVLHVKAQMTQEEVATADGWKPIIGSRKPNYYEAEKKDSFQYETLSTMTSPTPLPVTVTAGPSRKPFYRVSPKPIFLTGRKVPHQKHAQNAYFALPSSDKHGPHIPIGAVIHTRPSQIGHIKHATTGKPFMQTLKPGSHRDEIFAASATSGSYNSQIRYKPSNVRTRETLEGIAGFNHQYDFTNRYPANAANFQAYANQPIPLVAYRKHQPSNDEFIRNLIPPPQVYKPKPKPSEVVLQAPPPFPYTPKNEVQVQVTKEKIQEYPANFHSQYIDFDLANVRKPAEPPRVYEVTESPWAEPSQKPRTRPSKPRPEVNEQQVPVFLPTPYRPITSSVEPTLATQDVSTIYTQLSQKNKEILTTLDPFSFNVKEVSTHYPIFGRPMFELQTTKEVSNDLPEVTPTEKIRPQRRRRPEARRTTSTTEAPATEMTVEMYQEKEEENTERPVRIRRPNRYRTTTVRSEEKETSTARGRNRYRVQNNDDATYENVRRRRPQRVRISTPDASKSEEYYHHSSQMESEEAASEKSEEIEKYAEVEPMKEEDFRIDTIKPFIIITSTEKATTTDFSIPENELDATVAPEETTTVPPTTTTRTTVSRIKRPYRFDNSNRPRFSVKDFRQKLSQQSSTTAEPQKSTESVRIRLPSRMRRPSTTPAEEEEGTESRHKFAPKEPRHSSSTEGSIGIITEKNVKSVNTRLRPFGRYKSTPSTTTTAPKVSIKPNLFTRKRPPVLTLKSRISSKLRNATEEVTKQAASEDNEVRETTEHAETESDISATTEAWDSARATEKTTEVDVSTTDDISEVDPFFYSQRVSDLTSSTKNDYDTPGAFKSLAPVSRRIPSHFTLATDDPILPIEAFFSNIKEKMSDN